MHILLPDGIHDRFHRHITAQVDDLKAIILQDDPDDVLADVVDIALDGGNDDASLAGAALALLGNGGLDLLKGSLRGGGRLQQLRQSLDTEEQVGFGLRTVYRRLRLLYGAQCSMELESEPGAGTTVTLRFPIRKEAGA